MMFILGHSQAIVTHQRQATDRLLGRQTEGHRSRQEHLYHHQRIVVCVRSPSSHSPSYNQFEKWCEKNSFPLENVINDQSMTNDTRLGAIADINLALKSKKEQIGNSDGIPLLSFFPIPLVFIIAGDTLLYPDFDLKAFLLKYLQQTNTIGIVCNKVQDEEVHKRGIIEVCSPLPLLSLCRWMSI